MSLYISPSTFHGTDLFSDKAIAINEEIGVVFNKQASTGVFVNDYKENMHGRYTNHSACPNAFVIIKDNGLVLKALQPIKAYEEITANYHQLIELFSNDETLIKLIKFW